MAPEFLSHPIAELARAGGAIDGNANGSGQHFPRAFRPGDGEMTGGARREIASSPRDPLIREVALIGEANQLQHFGDIEVVDQPVQIRGIIRPEWAQGQTFGFQRHEPIGPGFRRRCCFGPLSGARGGGHAGFIGRAVSMESGRQGLGGRFRRSVPKLAWRGMSGKGGSGRAGKVTSHEAAPFAEQYGGWCPGDHSAIPPHGESRLVRTSQTLSRNSSGSV